MLAMSRLFLTEESGQSLTEYALIVSILVLCVLGAVLSFGNQVNLLFNNVSDQLPR